MRSARFGEFLAVTGYEKGIQVNLPCEYRSCRWTQAISWHTHSKSKALTAAALASSSNVNPEKWPNVQTSKRMSLNMPVHHNRTAGFMTLKRDDSIKQGSWNETKQKYTSSSRQKTNSFSQFVKLAKLPNLEMDFALHRQVCAGELGSGTCS